MTISQTDDPVIAEDLDPVRQEAELQLLVCYRGMLLRHYRMIGHLLERTTTRIENMKRTLDDLHKE